MLAALMALTQVASTLAQIRGGTKQLTSNARALAGQVVQQTRSDIDLLQLQGYQTGAKITLDQVRRYRQGARERSTISARTADAGVGGGTTIRDAVASVIQQESDVATMETQKDWALNQNIMEQKAAVVRGQSRVNEAQSMLNQRTGTGPGVLQLISAGVSGYSAGKQLEPMYSGKSGYVAPPTPGSKEYFGTQGNK